MLGCSQTGIKLDPLGPAGGGKDDIPDEFPQEKQKNPNSFIDKTTDYGLAGIEAYNFNVVDFNGDNYSDLAIIPSFYSEPEFYFYNIGKRRFEKAPSPFTKAVKASFMLFYDINQDKVLDAIVGVLNQKTELSREPLKIFYGKQTKEGLRFNQGTSLNISTPNSTVGLIDYNLDGKLDLFVGNWFKRIKGNPFPHPDYLFINSGKGFKERSDLLVDEHKMNPDKSMHVNATPTYSSQICDMDQNGFPDILTTSTNRYENKMWMNRYEFRGKKRYFENQAKESGFAADPEGLINQRGGGRTFGVSCADYNNDGIMDVFLGELNHNYDNDGVDKSSILTGRTFKYPPKFFRTEYFLDSYDPNWHEADRRGIWTDLNNDGLLDLIVDNSGYPPHSRLIVFEQLPDHSFVNRAETFGVDIINPIATVVADFNRDGRVDILTAQSSIRDELIKPRIYLFENQLDLRKNRSVRLFLRGKQSNTQGLNATVVIKIRNQDITYHRMQHVNYSYGALPPQLEEGIHFGLIEGESIESIIVRWPYSKSPNASVVNLEKIYPFNVEFKGYLNITLCEDGNYLIGRRECL